VGLQVLVHSTLVAAVGLLGVLGVFAWILRDGMGPSATESAGWEAVRRWFWCFYWGPAMLAASGLLWLSSLAIHRPEDVDRET